MNLEQYYNYTMLTLFYVHKFFKIYPLVIFLP